jgi:F-type H+-transporting ATPase subunit delta
VDNATIARSYATALFELAERKKEVDAISRAFASVNALFASNRRIGEFLNSPTIEVDAKKQALRVTLEGRVPPIFLNFLLVVLDKRRQRLLRDVVREYDLLMDEKMGRVNVEVTLAHQPDAGEMQAITSKLAGMIGKSVVPHVHVDPSIIGGIIVRYGDRLLDGSLRRQLLSLRGLLMQADIANRTSSPNPG